MAIDPQNIEIQRGKSEDGATIQPYTYWYIDLNSDCVRTAEAINPAILTTVLREIFDCSIIVATGGENPDLLVWKESQEIRDSLMGIDTDEQIAVLMDREPTCYYRRP
ncbi:hypothetical protein [Microbulbifer pacificus]|uniref:hypothetical protein n=1 Tax=Microbulbifer pacificus TaxID=407164 RepID=UPI000CF4748B|nr:hypothetical protein [Microbulbifer pacificus]